MNELMTQLSKSLEDEIEGVMNYSEMSRMAKSSGNPKVAAILQDMAEEEFCHAKHLKELIHEGRTGTPPTNHAEMVAKYSAAKAAVNEI